MSRKVIIFLLLNELRGLVTVCVLYGTGHLGGLIRW